MTTFSKEKFALRLKKQRLAAGFERQADLAQASGISPQAVSAYEAGDRLPSADTLAMIANALGCTADYLVQLEDNTQRQNADLGKQTGLRDDAINCLKKNQILASGDDELANRGKHALGMVNTIVGGAYFDSLVDIYSDLILAIKNKIKKSESIEEPDFDIRLHRLDDSLMLSIDPEVAIDFSIHQLSTTVSLAIRDELVDVEADLSGL